MQKIKLNGLQGIIIIGLSLLIAGGTILLAVGGKKLQIENNTLEIANVKKVHQKFQDKISNELKTISGDLKVIKYALGIKE